MIIERFWLGLAWHGRELPFRSHHRRPLALVLNEASGVYANADRVDFGAASEDLSFIDGLAISAGVTSDVLATSQLIVPLFVRAGHFVAFEPGTITMPKRAILALRGVRRPSALAS